ncbi:Gfo/Idh/MocA family protein [Clostridium sp. 'White wine YQ']|uniref:Gfo/Idh/MocA family protein n=1 Tax=Clostridium sp. 'White wine YQ' TaxID=3027474 RepID=UPI0023659B0E|nr:Gfo/Idh/MocA family oxidoreductase [Clostridium sp. 'White wine YQ']MDD7793345.1 Gfo/Idh/MocA family oxidoreductase [Clostridium sp. 'White wine YQ']
MKKLRWGIIGLGEIANKFAQAVTKMENVELVSVASRSMEKSIAFGNKYSVSKDRCYGSYEDIVKDDTVDAIYVAVLHPFHKDISIMCLENGKAVLCEKPVTISEEEVKEVIKTAEENKVFFMEAMKTRFLPINKKVKEWIEEGRIGDVRLLQADFGFKAEFDPLGRLYNKELGGGALLDVGIYTISYSSFIFGNKPISIGSNLYIGSTGVDECASINLTYNEGKQAQLYGAINVNSKREANIIGTEGRICVERFSSADTATIWVNGREEEKIYIPFDINGFEYQINEVVDCISNGKFQSEIMSWQDSIDIMRIMDEVRTQGIK